MQARKDFVVVNKKSQDYYPRRDSERRPKCVVPPVFNNRRSRIMRIFKPKMGLYMTLIIVLLVPMQTTLAGELELTQHGIRLTYPDTWETTKYAAGVQLRRQPTQAQHQKGLIIEAETPKMIISTENRLHHAGAVGRLHDIGGMEGATWKYLEIGGWPALQQQYLRFRPQPSGGVIEGSEMIIVVQTVVAADNVLLRLETWLTPDATNSDVDAVHAIGRSMVAPTRGDPAKVMNEVKALQSGVTPYHQGIKGTKPSATGSTVSTESIMAGTPISNPELVSADSIPNLSAGASIPVATGGGRDSELEIAVSPNGQDIVIGANATWYYSSDGGQTWNTSNLNGNDPSVAWGQSGGARGTFYGANIASPTTGMWTSVNGGQTWVAATAVYTCGQNGDPACGAAFPDQEHIASDRLNVTAGGDQVYSAWRHLTASGWGIVCTQDSATTWSTRGYFRSGDFPKPAVGADGFVYVVYRSGGNIMLDKFRSCETQSDPMTNEGGFPVTILANATNVACPTPGLDRCNFRNTLSGITVAVDDTDANHVYVTYAVNTFPGGGGSPVCNDQNLCNENIVVQDSIDGGATWPGGADRTTVINTAVTARRFMPWLCTIDGTAHVSWYDRRAAFPGGTTQSNNSLTDFYAGSASLDILGNLKTDGEFQVNAPETLDAQCEAGFATGSTGSWPSLVDNARDSEGCSVQPQLGGGCQDTSGQCVAGFCNNGTGAACTTNANCIINQGQRCDFSDCGGSGSNNGSVACPCNVGPPVFTCNKSRGSPKYGDYNGNACAAGRLYMTWASAQAPLAFPAATNIDSFFSSEVVCCVSQIQVPGDINFDDSCGLDEQTEVLNVCNTGKENLEITLITGDDQFGVTAPLSGYPVNISPDFCFPFEATFNPDGIGADAGVLTIFNNDPVNPALQVGVSGSVGEPNINTIMDQNYGDVCLGNSNTQQLTLLNDGNCDLRVGGISIVSDPGNEFSLATVMSTPFTLKSGESISADIEFAPTGDIGGATAQVEIDSDDPDTATKTLDLTGNSPTAIISTFIANSGSFNEVCSGDIFDLALTVQNDGACPLEIDLAFIALGTNALAGDFVTPDGNADGTVIAPASSIQIPIRFAPSAFDIEPPLTRLATVDITSHTQFASSSVSPVSTPISGVVPPPDINLAIANSGIFPNVCKTDLADLDLNLFNQGKCDLSISGITLSPDAGSFELPAELTFPLILSPDADFDVPIRFSPDGCFDIAEERIINIFSDDPDEGQVDVGISGVSPCPNLVIDPADLESLYVFPTTVADSTGSLGCFNDRNITLRNNGECPLEITNISALGTSGNLLDYAVIAPTLFPVILPTGEETLAVTVRFTPQTDADPLAPSEVLGLLTVVSDDPDGDGTGDLCGESSLQSGIRVLTTDISSGVPLVVEGVDNITIRSKGKKTPSPINLQFTDVDSQTANICGNTVIWHVDQETLPNAQTEGSNPKSSYQVSTKEGNLQDSQSFSLNQCDFLEFQLQLQDSDAPACTLLSKGAACTNAGQCCSGKCKGPSGGKTCK